MIWMANMHSITSSTKSIMNAYMYLYILLQISAKTKKEEHSEIPNSYTRTPAFSLQLPSFRPSRLQCLGISEPEGTKRKRIWRSRTLVETTRSLFDVATFLTILCCLKLHILTGWFAEVDMWWKHVRWRKRARALQAKGLDKHERTIRGLKLGNNKHTWTNYHSFQAILSIGCPKTKKNSLFFFFPFEKGTLWESNRVHLGKSSNSHKNRGY